MARYKKYIILENYKTREVKIRFGYPFFHKDLIESSDKKEGWECIGGGFWDIDFRDKEIILYGDSTDFGMPRKEKIKIAISNINKHDWWQFKWICEHIFETKSCNDIEKFNFIIDY